MEIAADRRVPRRGIPADGQGLGRAAAFTRPSHWLHLPCVPVRCPWSDGMVQQRAGGGVSGANLLVLVPWLIFGACVVAICCRLFTRRGAARRRRRDGRE